MTKLGKYRVPVNINLLVDSRNKVEARRAVRDIPWDDILRFDYPRAGFVREFVIRVDGQPKIHKIKDN